MNTPRFAKLLARWLGALEVSRAPDPQALARSVLTIERALTVRRKRRRRRWLWGATGAAACAAGLLLALELGRVTPVNTPERPRLLATPSGGGAWLGSADARVALGEGLELSNGSTVTTASNGGAELVFATGTRVRVEHTSSLHVLDRGVQQRLALLSGGLEAHVAKLQPGERFVVELPDAEVEVRGTAFRLSLDQDCRAGARATLRVDEGLVEVRTATEVLRVAAGQSWQASCDVVRKDSQSPAVETVDTGVTTPAPTQHVQAHPPAPVRHSTLTEQNALFAAAVAAQRRGEQELALTTYARVAERFPTSALVESALLARVRLLAHADAAAARREAQSFVRRYPSSIARREVEALLESK